MRKSPESGRVPISEAEVGMFTGYLGVAMDGYQWDQDLQPFLWASPENSRGTEFGSEPEEKGPWLRPVTTQGALYQLVPILKERSLLTEFVALSSDPSQVSIRRFANRWGQLGRRSLEMVRREGDKMPVLTVDALATWDKELDDFLVLWETWNAVSTLSQAAIHGPTAVRAARHLLASRIRWHAGSQSVSLHLEDSHLLRMALIAAKDYRGELLESFEPGDVVEPARFYVQEQVTEKLAGHVDLSLMALAGRGRDTRIRFRPRDLVAAVYLQFAMEITRSRGPERECPACRKPFLVRRKDQQYCDKNCRERAAYHRRAQGQGDDKTRKR